jgi:hypothetical protein
MKYLLQFNMNGVKLNIVFNDRLRKKNRSRTHLLETANELKIQ